MAWHGLGHLIPSKCPQYRPYSLLQLFNKGVSALHGRPMFIGLEQPLKKRHYIIHNYTILTCKFDRDKHDLLYIASGLSITCQALSEKENYQLALSDPTNLGLSAKPVTIEKGCLGHHLPELLSALRSIVPSSTAAERTMLRDKLAQSVIASPHAIFRAHRNPTWT